MATIWWIIPRLYVIPTIKLSRSKNHWCQYLWWPLTSSFELVCSLNWTKLECKEVCQREDEEVICDEINITCTCLFLECLNGSIEEKRGHVDAQISICPGSGNGVPGRSRGQLHYCCCCDKPDNFFWALFDLLTRDRLFEVSWLRCKYQLNNLVRKTKGRIDWCPIYIPEEAKLKVMIAL